MKGTYRVLAMLVPIVVGLQAFAIGLEIFGLGDWVIDGNSFTKSVLEGESGSVPGSIGGDIHFMGAGLMFLVGLILLIVSFFAKIPGGVKWASIVFLDIVLQWVFAFGGFIVAWQLGALHGLNAIILATLGLMAYNNAKKATVATEVPASAAA